MAQPARACCIAHRAAAIAALLRGLGRIRGVVHQRLGADGDLVAEELATSCAWPVQPI
jgi:hypothetical protein